MWVSNLGDAQGNVGINQNHRGSLSSGIVNCAGVDGLTAIVHQMAQRHVAIGPGVKALEPWIVGTLIWTLWVEDDDPDPPAVQILTGYQIIPIALNHHIRH